MHLIRYAGRIAAIAGRDDIVLIPPIAGLADQDPGKRWVSCLAFVAREIERGNLNGAYTEARANRFARLALIPDDEFDARAGIRDAALAAFFNVPLSQIAEKRLDRDLASQSCVFQPERFSAGCGEPPPGFLRRLP